MKNFLLIYVDSMAEWWFRAIPAKMKLVWPPSSPTPHPVRRISKLPNFAMLPHYCQSMRANRAMPLAHTRRPWYTETEESTHSILGLPYPSGANLHPGLNARTPCADYDWHYTDTLLQASSGNESVAHAWKVLDLNLFQAGNVCGDTTNWD
eukprot:2207043-Pyramimonas_sp.AAC.1